MELLYDIADSLLSLALDAGVYVLLGFTVAGLLNWAFPPSFFMRFLNRGRLRSIVNAALIGVPLPLCSCSVIPTALTIGKRGASKGATASFLVSTPESGVDSIAITYGLLDGVMAIYRPFAALVSAVVTGLLVEIWGGQEPVPEAEAPSCGCDEPEPPATESCCDSTPPPPPADESCCSDEPAPEEHGDHDHDHDHSAEEGSWWDRSFGFAFGTLFDETAYWLAGGLFISGIVAGVISEDFVQNYLGAGLLPKLVMVLVGVPIYVCASASTPLAASLVAMGMAPGTALVLLMAGPATNVGTVMVFYRFFGARFAVIYVSSIAVCSIALGFLLDFIYQALAIDPQATTGAASEMFPFWLQASGAVVFLGLLLRSIARTAPPGEFVRVGRWIAALTGFNPTRKALAKLFVGVAIVGYASTGLSGVRPGEEGFVVEFGAVTRSGLGPGLYAHAPWPLGRVERVQIDAVRRIALGFAPGAEEAPGAQLLPTDENRSRKGLIILTGDENMLDITATLHWRVADAYRYAFAWTPEAAEEYLANLACEALLQAMAGESIDAVYTTAREEVEGMALARMRDSIAGNQGLEVLAFQCIDVHAPREVHDAFRDIASAFEDQHRYRNEAEAYSYETTGRAAGEAARLTHGAAGQRALTEALAHGAAAGFLAQLEEYKDAPEFYRERVFLEFLEQELAGAPKIIKPVDGGGLDLWRLNREPTRSVPGRSELPNSVADFLNQRRQGGGQ